MITVIILGIEKETFDSLINFLIRESYDQRKKNIPLLSLSKQPKKNDQWNYKFLKDNNDQDNV